MQQEVEVTSLAVRCQGHSFLPPRDSGALLSCQESGMLVNLTTNPAKRRPPLPTAASPVPHPHSCYATATLPPASANGPCSAIAERCPPPPAAARVRCSSSARSPTTSRASRTTRRSSPASTRTWWARCSPRSAKLLRSRSHVRGAASASKSGSALAL